MMRSESLIVGCVCVLALTACGGVVTTGDDETTTSSSETTVTTIASGTEATMDEPTTTTVMETPTTAAPTTTTTTDERSTTTPAGTTGPADDGSEVVTGEVPQELMDRVFTAAEDETGIDRSDIAVLRAESVMWADGSLGCPEPGVMYTQATVDGYWVELAVGERTLDYRLSSSGQVHLCTSDGATKPADGP